MEHSNISNIIESTNSGKVVIFPLLKIPGTNLFLHIFFFLRLALLTVLNLKMGCGLCVIGMVCSSFVSISIGTHYRAPWDPLGRSHIPMVATGNQLASRCLGSLTFLRIFLGMHS